MKVICNSLYHYTHQNHLQAKQKSGKLQLRWTDVKRDRQTHFMIRPLNGGAIKKWQIF